MSVAKFHGKIHARFLVSLYEKRYFMNYAANYMATYHLSVKTGSKGSALKHAQYIERCDSGLSAENRDSENPNNHFEYVIRANSYSHKKDLILTGHGNMPYWADIPDVFWAAADKYERVNGRTYTEIEFSLPRELSDSQNAELIKKFIHDVLGEKHAYTWAFHKPVAADGEDQPHAHLMFSERLVDGINRDAKQYFKRHNPRDPHLGGAKKDRYMNSRAFIYNVREQWTNTCNDYLEQQGLGIRIDHRSYEERDINLRSQNWIKSFSKDEQVVKDWALRVVGRLRETMRANGEIIIQNPEEAIKALTSNNSAFTIRDLQKFIANHTDGEQQYIAAYNAVLGSEYVQKIVGESYYTSSDMHLIEANILAMVDVANTTLFTEMSPAQKLIIDTVSASRTFNREQKAAYALLTSGAKIVSVNGAAGTGKSYVLGALNEACSRQGRRIFGVAFQAATARDMQESGGMQSMTIDAFLKRVSENRIYIPDNSMILIDEAGMVGSRHLERLLQVALDNNAQIRMVGDSMQLSAVSAGAAFAKIQEYLAADCQVTLRKVMRQKDAEMRKASIALSQHDVGSAIQIYERMEKLFQTATQQEAADVLALEWHCGRGDNKIMLAHTNKDVARLNNKARALLKEEGRLSEQDYIAHVTDRKSVTRLLKLTQGDYIVFKQNNKEMGVVNGTRGWVERIEQYDNEIERLGVRLDDGRLVEFTLNDYNRIQHGYASTIHQAQGMTVDSTYLLISNSMNANLAYVGMTRHKQDLHVYYSAEHFLNADDLACGLNRSDNKLFVGDKQLIAETERFNQSAMINHRQSMADRLGKNPLSSLCPVLDASITDVEEVQEAVRAHPTAIVAGYKRYLEKQGELPTQYTGNGTRVGAGDYIELTCKHTIKTGLFGRQTIPVDQVVRIKSADKNGRMIVEFGKKEYVINGGELSFNYARGYSNAYAENREFREKVNIGGGFMYQQRALADFKKHVELNRDRAVLLRETERQRRSQSLNNAHRIRK